MESTIVNTLSLRVAFSSLSDDSLRDLMKSLVSLNASLSVPGALYPISTHPSLILKS